MATWKKLHFTVTNIQLLNIEKYCAVVLFTGWQQLLSFRPGSETRASVKVASYEEAQCTKGNIAFSRLSDSRDGEN